MNIVWNVALLCALTHVCTAFAAERPAAAAHGENLAVVLPANVALLDFDAIPSLPSLAPDRRPTSSGVVPSLPDMPDATLPGTQMPFYLFQRGGMLPVDVPVLPVKERMTFEERVFDAPSVSLIDASPLAGAARHIGAQKFNTADGSMIDNFAICYRISKRSSVQVVPGDPAPVKLPIATMQNNMGVTVGMVVRLSRTR